MDSVPQKFCHRCDQHKPLDAFGPNRCHKDGLDNWCRECRRAYGREHWQRNPKEQERRRIYLRERYRNNPEHKRKQKAHSLASCHRRRARKEANGGSYTAKEWRALCAYYNHRCACCGQHKKLTVDHVIPLSKGGTNDISNLQPLCLDCNLRKSTSIADYRTLVQLGLEWGD